MLNLKLIINILEFINTEYRKYFIFDDMSNFEIVNM